MADRLTKLVSQSSVVKPTLPVGVITSHVIVVGAQASIYNRTAVSHSGNKAEVSPDKEFISIGNPRTSQLL
ncbi:hypothetical protein ElyMa_006801300 [Elysia marginata]|uniref:Uncharacterized protein n=1 Tax=Elysia marginata TaxID=1093978 RepID=A0AAV4J1H1_9GAST|nr:hypothetical protein ElyMa_006801300 [Elysia marginata]